MENEIKFTDLAKEQGFIYDEDTMFNVEGNKCNAYLIASDQLMARVGFTLEQTLGRELFEDFMENIKNGQDIPNFYANYDFNENKINLVSTVYFADRNGEYRYDELELLATETEQKLLLGALNEYSISLDGKDIFEIMQMFQEERNHSYDPSFEVRYSVEELEAQAEALYDARNRNFGQFTNGELYELYKMCLLTPENPHGRSFDDEVFDEIDRRQYEGRDLIETFKDKYTEETGFEWPERKFVMNVDDITVCDDNVTLEVPLENTSALIKLVANEIGISVEDISKRDLTLLTTINLDIEGSESDKVGNLIYNSYSSIEDQKCGEIELSDFDKHMIYTITEKNCIKEFGQDLEQYRDAELEVYPNEIEKKGTLFYDTSVKQYALISRDETENVNFSDCNVFLVELWKADGTPIDAVNMDLNEFSTVEDMIATSWNLNANYIKEIGNCNTSQEEVKNLINQHQKELNTPSYEER